MESRTSEQAIPVSRELWAELELHARLEEEIFYPALEACSAGLDPKVPIETARSEHARARALIARMRGVDPQEAQFVAYLEELHESVRLHLEEEERVLLGEAERLLKNDLQGLGTRWQSRRKELLGSEEFREAAHPELAQNPNGGEQKRAQPAA